MVDLTALSTSGRLEIRLTTLVAGRSRAVRAAGAPISEPMISLELWDAAPDRGGEWRLAFLAGTDAIGLTTFLPVFVQGVMQKSPLIGTGSSAMALGWPIGARSACASASSASACAQCCVSAACWLRRARLFSLSSTRRVRLVVAGLGSMIVGLGMGLASSASIILIQEIVDWSERGSVTAPYLFARSLGSTFGATVFGCAVLNFGLLRTRPRGRVVRSAPPTAGAGLRGRGRSRGFAPRSNNRFTSSLRIDVRGRAHGGGGLISGAESRSRREASARRVK